MSSSADDRSDKPQRAVLFGLSGTRLSDDEKRLIEASDPLGFCLFARNVKTPDQVRELTRSLRQAARRQDIWILIDQEGGRVQRLRPPYWPKDPAPAEIGALAARDREAGRRAAALLSRAIAADVADLGINVNTAPVLDLRFEGMSDVVGDRSFGADPELVAELGRIVCEQHLDRGVLPVIKHLPGHGRTKVDSHHALPVVDDALEVLAASDFLPFAALRDMPVAMTAHVVYTAVDPARPATQSPRVIGDIIRGTIGFDGFLLSDDLTMDALSGSPGERAAAAIAAGCDAVLQCDGNIVTMTEVAASVPFLTEAAQRRLRAARGRVRPVSVGLDPEWRRQVAHLLGEGQA